MDATLLNRKHRVSAANREAIEYFTAGGGIFTVASGRMVEAVRAYFTQMTINAPAILHNGAKIYDYGKEKTLFEKFIEEHRKQAIRRVHDDFPHMGIEVYADEKVYVYRECFETERFKTRGYDVTYRMPDYVWDMPWTKVLIIGRRKELDAVEPVYRRSYDSGFSVRSGDHFLDIVAGGVSKGLALLRLAGLLGIERENIYAAGDNMNDIDMLRAAGHSYAVENAEPEVKAAAENQAPSCDNDAIAYIVGHL